MTGPASKRSSPAGHRPPPSPEGRRTLGGPVRHGAAFAPLAREDRARKALAGSPIGGEQGHDVIDRAEVLDHGVGTQPAELRSRASPRGHQETTGLAGPGAGQVVGGVADHPDLVRLEGGAPQRFGPAHGDGNQRPPIGVVAPVGADLEVEPPLEVEGGQLDHRVGGDVAGEHRLEHPLGAIQPPEHGLDTGKDPAPGCQRVGGGGQLGLQVLENEGHVVVGLVDLHQRQVLADDLRIGLAAHGDPPGRAPSRAPAPGPGRRRSPPVGRPDERPVDIPQHQSPHPATLPAPPASADTRIGPLGPSAIRWRRTGRPGVTSSPDATRRRLRERSTGARWSCGGSVQVEERATEGNDEGQGGQP